MSPLLIYKQTQKRETDTQTDEQTEGQTDKQMDERTDSIAQLCLLWESCITTRTIKRQKEYLKRCLSDDRWIVTTAHCILSVENTEKLKY